MFLCHVSVFSSSNQSGWKCLLALTWWKGRKSISASPTGTVFFWSMLLQRLLSSNPSTSLSALAHAPNCTHKALEGLQDGFQQCPHSSAGFSIAHLRLTLTSVSSAISGLWPQLHVLSHDDCLRWMEAGEGSPETKGKKTDEKSLLFNLF